MFVPKYESISTRTEDITKAVITTYPHDFYRNCTILPLSIFVESRELPMMEHTTDRLFWTLTSVIVGALILTIGINAFPKATQGIMTPMNSIVKQTDNSTKMVNDVTAYQTAPEASSLNFKVTDNGDGTGTIQMPDNIGDGCYGTRDVVIPPYMVVNHKPLKITHIGENAFAGAEINSVQIPDTVTQIDWQAFCDNHLTSITIPNSVTKLGNNILAVNAKLTTIKMNPKLLNNDYTINNLTGNNNNHINIVDN